jgi:two-component system chemotaxis sensor kinase CheA
MHPLEKQIDLAATSLVMLDPGDMPSLASLHDIFQALRDSFKVENSPLASVAQKCADLIEKIIMREVQDVPTALTSLSDAIVGLQAVIRDGRELSVTRFPEDLKPEQPAVSKTPSSKKQKTASQPSSSSKPATAPAASSSDTPADSAKSKAAAPAAHKAIGNLTMQFQGADTSLVAEFINEARDHCLTAEQKMMDLETGADYEATINAIFRSFHTIKGAAGFLELRPISVLSHESETLLDLVRKGTMTIEGRTADVIFAAIDGLRKLLSATEEGLKTGGDVDGTSVVTKLVEELRGIISGSDKAVENPALERVGDILVDMGATTQDAIDTAIAHKQSSTDRIGETLVKQGVVHAQAVAHALRDQRMAQRENAPAQTAVKEMVKIDTERLDKLVDTIGELVIAESMVGHDEDFLAIVPPRIAKNVSHLNKITRELQEMGMAMRLVPVRATFQKLARAVRDLTRKSGKKVELMMSGEDVEVDRSIIEHIGDPLMHMIRNSVDHAIEAPDERVACGKPETGRVWLRAYHRGGNIQFEIEDDGHGLDTDRILVKAREKNLVDHTRELSEREIFNLILLPGFSTAKQVTDISGRGVGMDVVKKNIDAMRGHLEIDSKRGQGTKFTMKLPLTMAMIDGMLIRVATERYIVPTLSVIESINLAAERIFTVRGRQEMINLRGSMLPIVRLSQVFELSTGDNNDGDRIVVVVEDNESRIGIVAEELIGQRQTVIKSLGPLFSRQKWVSGGAILTDGTVGLILDVNGLIHLANSLGESDATGVAEAPQPKVTSKNSEIVNMETSEADDPVDELQLC